MNSSNPLLSSSALTRTNVRMEPMTLEGTSNRTMLLLLLLFISAVFSWESVIGQLEWATQPQMPWFFYLGLIGGLGCAIASMIKPHWSPYTAPAYALLKGLAIGAISAFFEFRYPGIVFQAVLATFGTAATMLILFRSGTLRATPTFKKGVIAATGGIAIVYLISFVMSFFGTQIPFIHEAGPIGIGFSVVVVVLASLNLILDFDLIQRGIQSHAPKYMEWFCALGLLVTLVWLYLEILRLLSKLRSK
jgi:uncharacterized YccA/Bax inhibitor family protein